MNDINQRIEFLIEEGKRHKRESLMSFRLAAFSFIVGLYLTADNHSAYALAAFAVGLALQVSAAKKEVFAEIANQRFDQAFYLEKPFANASERVGDLVSRIIDDLKSIKSKFGLDRE
jgi:hypothetical protein